MHPCNEIYSQLKKFNSECLRQAAPGRVLCVQCLHVLCIYAAKILDSVFGLRLKLASVCTIKPHYDGSFEIDLAQNGPARTRS